MQYPTEIKLHLALRVLRNTLKILKTPKIDPVTLWGQ